MHCTCCDHRLTDFEATRKDARTEAYLDLCNQCFSVIGHDCAIPTIDRHDLSKTTIGDDSDEDIDNGQDDLERN
jgi:hypothetical protein